MGVRNGREREGGGIELGTNGQDEGAPGAFGGVGSGGEAVTGREEIGCGDLARHGK